MCETRACFTSIIYFSENKLSEGGLTHYEKPINVKQ